MENSHVSERRASETVDGFLVIEGTRIHDTGSRLMAVYLKLGRPLVVYGRVPGRNTEGNMEGKGRERWVEKHGRNFEMRV